MRSSKLRDPVNRGFTVPREEYRRGTVAGEQTPLLGHPRLSISCYLEKNVYYHSDCQDCCPHLYYLVFITSHECHILQASVNV